MTFLQGIGSLLYGALTLVGVAVLAVLAQDKLAVTLALAALAAGYFSCYLSFLHAYAAEHGQPDPKAAFWAWYAQWASAGLGLASFLLSVWV